MKKSKWIGMKNFYQEGGRKRSTIFLVFLFALLGFLEILPAIILTCIIDIYSKESGDIFGIAFRKENVVLLFIILALIFFITYIGSQQLRAYVRIKEKKYMNELRGKLHNSIVKNCNSLSHPVSSGEILNNISHDVYAVEKIYTIPLNEAVSPIVAGVSAVIYLFFLNYIIALISLAFVPLFIILSNKMIKKMYSCNKEIKENQVANNNYFGDVLANFPVISLFSGYQKEIKEYETAKDRLLASEKKQALLLRKYWFLMNMLRVIIFIATLSIAGVFINSGELGIGSLLLVYNFVQHSNKPIFSTNKIINDMEIASVDLERLYSTIQVPDDEDSERVKQIKQIEYKNVCIDLPKFKIENLNMILNYDKPNYVLGDSGAGKSLAVSLLYRKFDYSGDIIVDGKKIEKLSFKDVSVSMQNHYVFSRDIKDNLLYPDKENLDEKLIETLNIDLKKLSRQISSGSLSNLSGGEKQKISLYRCLTKDAKVYILDEPTNDLDNKTIKNLKKYIEENNKFYIIITHNKDFVTKNSNCITIKNHK